MGFKYFKQSVRLKCSQTYDILDFDDIFTWLALFFMIKFEITLPPIDFDRDWDHWSAVFGCNVF